MKTKTKVHFTLSDEAVQVINRRAKSPNKRGDWLSAAIIAYDRILAEGAPDSAKELAEKLRALLKL